MPHKIKNNLRGNYLCLKCIRFILIIKIGMEIHGIDMNNCSNKLCKNKLVIKLRVSRKQTIMGFFLTFQQKHWRLLTILMQCLRRLV